MKNPIKIILAALISLSASALSLAQAPAAASSPTPAEPKPKVYMLISAVGDQFTYVTQKKSVGSNILDNFSRQVIKVPNDAINSSVLKGLDKAVEQRDPGSTRILARLDPLQMDGVHPIDREKVAMKKLMETLEKYPQRKDWDIIVVVTPKFQFSERKGMGSKLEGIGVYVQPLESATLTDQDTGADILGSEGEDTIDPDGKAGKTSKRYVAPYNYTQTWVFDAKTMKVLESSARYEFQRIYDPMSTALDVAKSIPVDKLATIFTNFVERSVARGLGQSLPSIEIGELKTVGVAAPAPKQ
ncbi:MAG: hypothetical protein ABI905_00120 [Betaproteobacteria bacterium]